MTKILVAIWALVMIQLSVWTYFAPSAEPQRPAGSLSTTAAKNGSAPVIIPADDRPDRAEATKKLDGHMLYGRDLRRKETIEKLSQPWSSFCGEDGRKSLVSSVGHYYYHRHNEVRAARERGGADAAKVMQDLYNAPEDGQIDRLTQQTYANGYFKLTDFKNGSFERTILAEVLKDEKVRGKGCDS